MKKFSAAYGFTIVELMVTILIVAILATTLGVFFVQLLTIQEKEREDAYVREKLADICADYAEMLSVGASFETNSYGEIIAIYPQEAGGVSLEYGGNYETGLVVRVAALTSSVQRVDAAYGPVVSKQILNGRNQRTTIALNVCALDANGQFYEKQLPRMYGDSELLIVTNTFITSCKLTRLLTNGYECASLGLLEVSASYDYRNKNRKASTGNATARRIVRLWNGK